MLEDRQEGWQADQAPRLRPLSYPGAWPNESILLADDSHFLFNFVPGARRLGQARVVLRGRGLPGDPQSTATEVPLNYALLRYNVASVNNRVPVLAVGSNASPAQMRHKFGRSGVSLVIPMVRAEVEGLAVGVAAEVARAGYVPATPIVGPDLASTLFVQWLDNRQLAALDATESSYTRVRLTPGSPDDAGVRVRLPSGEILGACYAYVANRGVLVHDGRPRRSGDQAQLLTELLAGSQRLRDLLGESAQDWIDRTREPGVIQAGREILCEEGWVEQQTALDRLVAAQCSRAAEVPAALQYRQILPATPRSGRGWIVVSSADPIDRRGQTCVRVAPSVAEMLGHPELVAIRPLLAEQDSGMDRLSRSSGSGSAGFDAGEEPLHRSTYSIGGFAADWATLRSGCAHLRVDHTVSPRPSSEVQLSEDAFPLEADLLQCPLFDDVVDLGVRLESVDRRRVEQVLDQQALGACPHALATMFG